MSTIVDKNGHIDISPQISDESDGLPKWGG